MNRFFIRRAALALLILALVLSFSGGSLAAVKATSLLTLAKLVKNGDAYSIVHDSGFTLLLPSDENLTVYEAKDSYGLRKLYLSSSLGPVIEISTAVLDSLTPGPLDYMAKYLFDSGASSTGGALGIKAAGVDGLRFTVHGKATAASSAVPVKVYTLLTDYERVILIVAHTQQTSLAAAEGLVGKLIIGLQLDGSWESTTE